jgi:serine/threonine protein kinase
MRQLLHGLDHLHQQQIVHADVKLENIMIANVNFKIDREPSNFAISDMHIGKTTITIRNHKLLGPWSIYHHSTPREMILDTKEIFGLSEF